MPTDPQTTMRGLRLGGPIRRDMAAVALCVPLLSYHRPGKAEWSWLLEWERARPSSGVRHGWFRVVRIPGPQSRTIVDVLRLGCFHFMRQRSA